MGPKRAEALEKLGVHTVKDLLYFVPRRYEDRAHFLKISEVQAAENVTIRGEVLTLGVRRTRPLPIFELVVGDDTGMIHAIWFNQAYLKAQFSVGMKVILSGKADLYQDRLQMNSPEYEIVDSEEDDTTHTGRIVPVYPLTEGLYQRSLRTVMKEVVEQHLEKEIEDFLPEDFKSSHGLLNLSEALREIHFPTTLERLEEAKKRMIFDEFFLFELKLLQRLKLQREKQSAFVLPNNLSHLEEFKRHLPFTLTSDQNHVMQELSEDFTRSFVTNRILQGEVGSGKTLVAIFALFCLARSGHQGAFLVPTEILAEQHARTLFSILKPFEISAELLTASTPPGSRKKIIQELQEGQLPILVGTHALLQENIKFRSLGIVIIDEQHKFGVRQRSHLLQTEPRPHQLVMTATPIPRTLALTLYGDLEVSTLRQMPAGRIPVKTFWITRGKQSEVLKHIRERVLEKNDQAYLVFPAIDETERDDLHAAQVEYERLQAAEFSGLKMGLVHGRLAKEEREKIMQSFREGKTQILIATSVIEVGVDNPNATLMVIENAERFGLSQLHQLRGRVGRGRKESECFLFGIPKTEAGKRRLRILTKTNDGFLIAEEDLKLRGPGELLGVRQSGEPYFCLGDPHRDIDLLLAVRKAVFEILKDDARLASPAWEKLRMELDRREEVHEA